MTSVLSKIASVENFFVNNAEEIDKLGHTYTSLLGGPDPGTGT